MREGLGFLSFDNIPLARALRREASTAGRMIVCDILGLHVSIHAGSCTYSICGKSDLNVLPALRRLMTVPKLGLLEQQF